MVQILMTWIDLEDYEFFIKGVYVVLILSG